MAAAKCGVNDGLALRFGSSGSDRGRHQIHGAKILVAAQSRWLTVSEMTLLLNPQESPLTLSTNPPSAKPKSGSLFLYDRRQTRYFRNDGHEWVKKKNSNQVREDFVMLRLKDVFKVGGCYARSLKNPSFYRRSYHLLTVIEQEDETGKKKTKNIERQNNLILVHYLDVKDGAKSRRNTVPQVGSPEQERPLAKPAVLPPGRAAVQGQAPRRSPTCDMMDSERRSSYTSLREGQNQAIRCDSSVGATGIVASYSGDKECKRDCSTSPDISPKASRTAEPLKKRMKFRRDQEDSATLELGQLVGERVFPSYSMLARESALLSLAPLSYAHRDLTVSRAGFVPDLAESMGLMTHSASQTAGLVGRAGIGSDPFLARPTALSVAHAARMTRFGVSTAASDLEQLYLMERELLLQSALRDNPRHLGAFANSVMLRDPRDVSRNFLGPLWDQYR